MTERSRELNQCGCITIKHCRETERMFCQDEYWSETLRCEVHEAEMIKLRAERAIQSAIIATEQKKKENIWLEHIVEINKIEHVSFVPIKALKDKGIIQTRIGYARLNNILLVTKMRNRFYVSKEKLAAFDPAKYNNTFTYIHT